MALIATNGFFRENGAIATFGIFTAVGCFFICFSKYLGWSPFLVTGFPVALMLGYAAVNWVSNGLRVHDEQAGDNLYYMGFLFTLTSLGASLYQFTSAESIDGIVRNFGVAVASTIVGIGLRILFNQTRRDPVDIERSTRHEMADMVRQIRSEMNLASREFASHRRGSNQMLEEGFEEIAKSAELSGQKIVKALESLTLDALKPIHAGATGINEILTKHSTFVDEQMSGNIQRFEQSAKALQDVSGGLEESIKRFAVTVDTTAEKLEGMKTPEQVLKIELGSILNVMAKITKEHAQRMEEATIEQREQFKQIRETFGPVDKILAGLDRSATISEKLIAVMHAQHVDFGKIVASIPSVSQAHVNNGVSAASSVESGPAPMAPVSEPIDVQSFSGKPDEPKRGWFST